MSDEDESINEFKKNPGRLVDSVAKLWPGKDFSFHSIVVNEGDDDCKDTFGHRVGKTYEWLSDRTNGVKASVCSKDYAEPLSHIGDKIRNAFRTIKLKCPPVDRDGDGVIDIEVNRSDFPKYTVNGSQLVLEELIPLGKYQIQYYCAVD